MRGRRFRPFRFGLVVGVLGAVVWFVQRQRAAVDGTTAVDRTPPVPARPSPSPVSVPTPTPAPATVAEPGPDPVAEPEPVVQPVDEPEPVVQPVDQPEPVVEPVDQPEPVVEPEPLVPIVAAEILEVGDLDRPGEPELETAEPAPQPAVAPVAKKARATKKAAPRKAVAKGAPAPPAKAPAKKKAAAAPDAWVAPEGGTCPTSHPVKAKLSSRLFHLPGMFAYARTNPDRCYLDAATAEADGLQRAKR